MKGNTNHLSKLQQLLTRFVDQSELTPDLIKQSYEYLFNNGSAFPFPKRSELFETLLYLKDLMELNELYFLEDIEWYYIEKKASLQSFIKEAEKLLDAQDLATQAHGTIQISWEKEPEIQKAVPFKAESLCVCYTTIRSCAFSPIIFGKANSFVPQITTTGNSERSTNNHFENQDDLQQNPIMSEI